MQKLDNEKNLTPEEITAAAALEAGVSARLAGMVRQAADHPVDTAVPEGAYLKGRLNYVAASGE